MQEIVGIRVLSCLMKSPNCFVLGDQMLWLGRWRSIKLSRSRGCFGSEDVLFEKALLDELFQVLPQGSAVDGHVCLLLSW